MKHRFIFCVTTILFLLAGLAGCGRDPEKVKARYLENGDKYMSQRKYKEAVLMYKNAIKRDPKFGEAYAKLGDAEMARGDARAAVAAFRRAVELLPKAEDPAGKLADIYLAAYTVSAKKNPEFIKEVKDLANTLLQKNPKSYHGYRLKGFLAVHEGDLDEAVQLFEKANEGRPDQPELLYSLAQVHNQAGRWEKAEELAKRIIAKNPKYALAYDFLITEYMRRKQQAEAEKYVAAKSAANPAVVDFQLQQAGFYRLTNQKEKGDQVMQQILAKESESPDARRKVGDLLVRLRDYDAALKVYNDGVAKNDGFKTDYRLRIVQIHVAQSKTAEALQLAEAVVKDDPKSNEALSMRASLQLQFGSKENKQGAISDLQTLLGRVPDNVVVRYNLARAYQSKGEIEAARVQYEEVMKLRKDFYPAYIGAGQVYLAKRDYGKAISSAEEVLKAQPKNLQARVIKTNALISSGNLRQARQDLNDYLRDGDAPDLSFQLATVDFLESRFKEAEAGFKELRQKYPTDLRLLYAIAEVQIRTNRQNEALRFLEDELKKQPDNADLRGAVATTALKIDSMDVAEREFRTLIQRDPKNFENYMKLGETLRRKGQVQQAIEYVKKGQQLQPQDPRANLQLALTLDAAGMKRESLPLYEAVLKGDPENVLALNNLAYTYADEGRDLDQALTYAQRAKQKWPTNDDVSDTLGWVYIKKKLNDNAITIFKELTSKKPKNPQYHYHLGVAQFQKGDRSAARQSLQTALSLKPEKNDEAKIRELLAKVS